MKTRFPARTLFVALLAIAFALPARCQEPVGPIHPWPGVKPEPAPIPKSSKPIKVRVNLVTVPVAVQDPAGRLVLNLREGNFEVFDDGVQQKITHFGMGGDPLSIALVIETSSRVEPLLPEIRKAGIIFTQMVMAGTSEAAVLGYDDGVELLRPMTTDPDRVLYAIRHLRVGTSGARLYDALERAEQLLEAQPEGRRRIILVMGEATDSGSETKLGAVLRQAQLANVAIYTIGLSTTAAAFRSAPSQANPPQVGPPGTFPLPPVPGTAQTPSTEQEQMGGNGVSLLPLIIWMVRNGANAVGHNVLKIASTATGGLHIGTFRDRSMEAAMNRIGNELHAEYMLAYKPPGNEPYGYHKIEVKVTAPRVRVRTRPGYYLAPPSG